MSQRSWFGRALAVVAPGLDLRRAQQAEAAAKARARAGLIDAMAGEGYATSDPADPWMRRWSTTPRDSASDSLRGLPQQRAHSRDLARNNPLAASAINTNVVRAVGTGLAFNPQPHIATLGWSEDKAKEWRALVRAEFSLWADSTDCDWYGDLNFYGLQDLVLRSALESGDCFSVLPDGQPTGTMPYALRVQVLEADRIGNPGGKTDGPDWCGGIARTNGRMRAVHIYRQHPGSLFATGDRFAGDQVDVLGRTGRRRVLHHLKRLRPEQPRGIPYLAPVMALFKLLGTYTDAEVKAAVVSSFLTLVIETGGTGNAAPIFTGGDPAAAAAAQTTGDVEMGPGAVIGLAKGEKATAVDPSRPNPAFGPFVQAVLDQLGAGTFIGSELLMKKFNTSYTAARAAFLDAWKHVLDIRTAICVRTFCQPVVETWMAEAVALGRVPAPGFFADPLLRWAYTRAIWHGDSQGSLNPKDEVAAYGDAVDRRLTTRERASWELFGESWADTYPVMVEEQNALRRDDMLPEAKPGAAKPASSANPEEDPPAPTTAPAPEGD